MKIRKGVSLKQSSRYTVNRMINEDINKSNKSKSYIRIQDIKIYKGNLFNSK